MCQVRDLILVFDVEYNDKVFVGTHPFLIIDDEGGQYKGCDIDFLGLLMSSYTDEEKRERLKKFDANFPMLKEDKEIQSNTIENRDAYLKADQFVYFNKNEINYVKIGSIDEEMFDLILEFIQEISDKGIKIKRYIGKSK